MPPRHVDIDLTDDSRFEISPEELKRIETRWKSDVDKKLDHVIAFHEEYKEFFKMLMNRERQREQLRAAILEKLLSGLTLAAVIGLLSLAWAGVGSSFREMVQSFKAAK